MAKHNWSLVFSAQIFLAFFIVTASSASEKVIKVSSKLCKKDEFRCNNGDCIPIAKFCDEHVGDCADNSDELHCDEHLCKPPFWYKCNDGKCMSHSFVCDGDNDCPAGEDEMNCENHTVFHNPTECTENEFSCTDKLCIPLSMACDGIIQCDDGSDETIGCNVERKCDGFHCANKVCLTQLDWFCDGVDDCGDNSDEINCTPHCTAEFGKYECSDNSTCISFDQMCDDKKDCPGGDDEGAFCKEPCKLAQCPNSCKITPTGPICNCPKGFQYNNENKTCEDVNECEKYGICSQICTNLPGSYKCECIPKFVLEPNNRTCVVFDNGALEGEPLMIFSTKNAVMGKYLTSNNLFSLATNLFYVIGVSYDGHNVYWTEITTTSASMIRAREDGSNREIILTSGLDKSEDLEIDWLTGNIYFSDSGRHHIAVCSNNGSYCQILIALSVHQSPRGIALHPQKGEFYWTDWGDKPMIGKAAMDGTSMDIFVEDNIKWPNGLALDWPNNRLYWIDAKLHTLESIRLDGRDRRRVLEEFIEHPFGISVFGDRIYWSDFEARGIKSCHKFTGKDINLEVIRRDVHDIHIYHSAVLPQVSHGCLKNICSHLCLLSTNNSYSCGCPEGMQIGPDLHTCKNKDKKHRLYLGMGNNVVTIENKIFGRHEKPVAHTFDMHISKIEFNSLTGELFVADNNKGVIYTLNLDTMISSVLISHNIGEVSDLAFDHLSNNLYWTDSKRFTVEVYSLKKDVRTIVYHFMGASVPIALAVVPETGLMFIALREQNHVHIDKQTLNGKGLHNHVIESGLSGGKSFHFAVDYALNLVYWSDTDANRIEFTDFEGESHHLFKGNLNLPSSLGVIDSKLFWTSKKSTDLFWAETHNDDQIKQIRIEKPYGISYPDDIPMVASKPLKISDHICSNENGGCSHICVSTGSTSRDCLCPVEMIYSDDENTTCVERTECEFRCWSGECLSEVKHCDGHINCADGSDEKNCNSTTKSPFVVCKYNQFPCEDGMQCIDQNLKCDKEFDCNDHSDEKEIYCGKIKFTEKCGKNQHSCGDGDCVDKDAMCDGFSDCLDGSDEINCTKDTSAKCDETMFKCKSGECIEKYRECDNQPDCIDLSDEHSQCKRPSCPPRTFRCQSGICIDQVLVCDGHNDCSDNSDESSCGKKVELRCKDNQFQCSSNRSICLELPSRCNGVAECPRGEDERDCTGCSFSEFECDNKKCIHREFVCDQANDCGDKSDEKNCNGTTSIIRNIHLQCPPDTFKCTDESACVEKPFLCDGKADCLDRSDEGGVCKTACKKNPCEQKCLRTPTGPVCGCHEGYFLTGNKKTCDDVDECTTMNPCAQKCFNTIGSYRCSCFPDFTLRMDKVSCRGSGQQKDIIFTAYDQIRKFHNNPPSISVLWSANNSKIIALDVDINHNNLYFTVENSGTIVKFNMEAETYKFVSDIGNPRKLALDWITDNVYFIDQHDMRPTINICHLERKACSILIKLEYRDIVHTISVDAINKHIFFTVTHYFISENPSSIIYRANLDGTELTILRELQNHISAITHDGNKKMIYFADVMSRSIRAIDYNGENLKYIIKYNSAIIHPIALNIFEDQIFIVNAATSRSGTCKLYGERECRVFNLHIDNIEDFVIAQQSRQKIIENVCLNHNCSHLCVPAKNGPKCLCHGGLPTDPDVACEESTDLLNLKFGEHVPLEAIDGDSTSTGSVVVTVLAIVILVGALLLAAAYMYRRRVNFGKFNISMQFEKSHRNNEENVKMCYAVGPQINKTEDYNELHLGNPTGGVSIVMPPQAPTYQFPTYSRTVLDETAVIEEESDNEFNDRTDGLNERLIR